MLKINVVLSEGFDDETQTFIDIESTVLELEHTLVSLSKWESKWEKPFLDNEKTPDEVLDYIRCMTVDHVDEVVYEKLSEQNIQEISNYINSNQSATVISERDSKKSGLNKEIVTSELLYYFMIAHQIPFECQHWHLNRLLTLIKVCNIKSQPEKKMSKSETLAENRELNRLRREKYKTKG